MSPEDLERLRDALGVSAIKHELARIVRLLQHARHPTRTPEHEYDDLEVMFDDVDDDDDGR